MAELELSINAINVRDKRDKYLQDADSGYNINKKYRKTLSTDVCTDKRKTRDAPISKHIIAFLRCQCKH